MLNKSVGRRYAEAFFAIAQEQNKIDEFEKELGDVVDVIMSHEDLKAFMFHVLIPPQEKKDICPGCLTTGFRRLRLIS